MPPSTSGGSPHDVARAMSRRTLLLATATSGVAAATALTQATPQTGSGQNAPSTPDAGPPLRIQAVPPEAAAQIIGINR